MKAISVEQFGGPEVLKLKELPQPEIGSRQVLLRVRAAGVNPVETYIRSGNYGKLPPLPYTPGKDGAGEVLAVANDVKNVRVGDRVYTSNTITGSYAEYAVCSAADVHRLPENVSFAQGAGINTPYATAYHALFHRAKARPGETLLIHGATGGVGLAAVQLACAAGLTVFGTGGTEEGRKLISQNGAHHVFDHRSPNYAKAIIDATNGRGVDAILEMLANVNLATDLTLLAIRGRVVVIGSRGKVEIDPRDAMMRDASVQGMLLFNATPEEDRAAHAAIIAGLQNETLRPVVGKEFPLAQASEAHVAVMQPGAYGKIVLVM